MTFCCVHCAEPYKREAILKKAVKKQSSNVKGR